MNVTIGDKIAYRVVNKSAGRMFQKVLSGKLPESTVSSLTNEIWEEYKKRLPYLEERETPGASLVVRLSLLTLILYEKLTAENIEKQEAIKLTSEITWKVYNKLSGIFWAFTKFKAKNPIKRLEKVMNFCINRFPYNSPGYEMEIIKADDNEFFFNVHKCPSAEFFREHQLSELCSCTWCDLDYSLAVKWNIELEREKSLAGGDSMCTFRFRAKKERNSS